MRLAITRKLQVTAEAFEVEAQKAFGGVHTGVWPRGDNKCAESR